jgi:hypothetical protein
VNPSPHAPSTGRTGRRAAFALFVLCALVIGVRLVLCQVGRVTVIDGFYLQDAFLLGAGRTPYEDFVQVAFPLVEALYAPVLSMTGAAGAPLVAASLVTGAAVLATSLLLFHALLPRIGRRGALLGGAAYALAAPVLGWHLFQREIWTNLALAAAVPVLLPARLATGVAGASDARAAAGGATLALALFAKLTAAVGAAALALELLLRRNARGAAIAAGALGLLFGAVALLCTAAWDGEFLTQVFLFYFFKGEAGTLAERLVAIGRHLDPVLALGAAGLALALWRGRTGLRFAAVLLATWLAYYALVSPSFWDHNAIDLALPAAAGAGYFVDRLLRSPRPAALAVAACCVAAGVRGVAPLRPQWFPHGLGGRQEVANLEQRARFLSATSAPDDLVLAETALLALLAGRESLVSDFELEPVARATLREVRLHGLAAAWRRRADGALLGAPPGDDPVAVGGSLFEQRVYRNTFYHLVPRILDAVRHRELAALLLRPESPLTPRLGPALEEAGYRRTVHDRVFGWTR